MYADALVHQDATQPFASKQPSAPKYEAISLALGAATSPLLLDWIASSWGHAPKKHDGAVLVLDHDYAIRREITFASALVAETVVPRLDRSSKDPGTVAVRLQPTSLESGPSSGKLPLVMLRHRLWRTGAFRLQIGGLDCTKVRAIDAFTVTRQIEVAAGGAGGVTLMPGRIAFPNLKVTLSEPSAKTWIDWHEDFVVDGNNSAAYERSGAISLLSVNGNEELTRIELRNLGILRIGQLPLGSAPHVMAELYCERMVLTNPGGPP